MGASGGYDGCDGLQSGPGTGDLGCVWYTEAPGFAAGSRQIADKRSVARSATTKNESSRTSEASPGLLLQELNFLDSSAQVSQSIRRQHAALDLVAIDGFEQRLEVAFAKAIVTLALDELEEHRPHQGGGEYLQQQPTLAAFR